jgi:hypothetical protein
MPGEVLLCSLLAHFKLPFSEQMLMWPTYTNIGADARSQFDLFSAMPGGLEVHILSSIFSIISVVSDDLEMVQIKRRLKNGAN